jgi:hypothetical protein
MVLKVKKNDNNELKNMGIFSNQAMILFISTARRSDNREKACSSLDLGIPNRILQKSCISCEMTSQWHCLTTCMTSFIIV